jgi:hypothetical protein
MGQFRRSSEGIIETSRRNRIEQRHVGPIAMIIRSVNQLFPFFMRAAILSHIPSSTEG